MHYDKPPCAECGKNVELSYLSNEAVIAWSELRRHGADVDTMSGAFLYVRYEALRMACDRYGAAADEIEWRVVTIDEHFVAIKNKDARKEHNKKK